MRNEIIKDLKLLENLQLTMTDDVKEKIQAIMAYCNENYSNQGFYGHAALNRKILLDPIIADNLTSEVIRHVMADKSELTQIKRLSKNNELWIGVFSDVIMNALSEGLRTIEALPNNEEKYCIKNYIQQKIDFQRNTRRILNSIQIASERSNPYPIHPLPRPTIARFTKLLDTLSIIKNNGGTDRLLEMIGYNSEQINEQMNTAFLILCGKLEINLSEKTLDEFCDLFLGHNDGAIFLEGDISHLFYDRLHLTAALISNERLYFENGIFTYRDLFQKIIEKINEKPGAYAIPEEQLSLRMSLIERNLVNNFTKELQSITSREKFLRQGPVKEKNKAHQDIEYILYCLIELEFPVRRDENGNVAEEHKEYLTQLPFNSKTIISFNSLQQINVTCPNGKTYNLSCALRNANLSYFRLLPETHEKLLQKLNAKPGISTASLKTIYQIEELAIRNYTKDSCYMDMNALLRGLSISTKDPKKINELILDSLLAISGVNKNVDNDFHSTPERLIVRLTENLPINISSQMMMPYGFSYLSGLTSFSTLESGAKYFQEKSIYIKVIDRSGRRPVDNLSQSPGEKEVIHSPMHLKFQPESMQSDSNGKIIISAEIENGPVTDMSDHYLSDSALIKFYETSHKNIHASPNENNRTDIAHFFISLSQKIREAAYVEPVIDYFKNYAKNEFLRKYCMELSSRDLEMIKIAVVFHGETQRKKTNEHGNLKNKGDDLFLFLNSTHKFLREDLSLPEHEIDYYFRFILNIGEKANLHDLNYEDLSTIFRNNPIHHIITLVHRLDLPRCVDINKYNDAVEDYRSNNENIEVSELQEAAFQQLEKLALYSIIETGDKLASGYSCNCDESNNESGQCNNDVFYCIARCEYAKLLSESDEKKINFGQVDNISRLNQVIRKNISLISSIFPDISIFLKPSLKNEELKILLDILIPRLKELNLNSLELKALFENHATSLEQKNIIFDYILSDEAKKNNIANTYITFFQMKTISVEKRNQLFNLCIKSDFFGTNQFKILFESKIISEYQQEKIIDFITNKNKEKPNLYTILSLLSFARMTENQKQNIINNFIESAKNEVEIVSPELVRNFMDFLDENQKKLFFTNVIESSKNIFERSADHLTNDEMTMYMQIWIKSLENMLQHDSRKKIADQFYINYFVEHIINPIQINLLFKSTKIKSEDQLLIFLLIKKEKVLDRFFDLCDNSCIPDTISLSIVELKAMHNTLNGLGIIADWFCAASDILKDAIKDPLNLKKLNRCVKKIDSLLSENRNSEKNYSLFFYKSEKTTELNKIKTKLKLYISLLSRFNLIDDQDEPGPEP